MSRPEKTNTVPVAPFSLREKGATPALELEEMLGKGFRIAYGASLDPRATVDPTPCPHCQAKVEWAATTRHKERYVYARCRGKHRHVFSNAEGSVVDVQISAPRPSLGMTRWLAAKTGELQEQMTKLQAIAKMISDFDAQARTVRPMPPLPQVSPIPDTLRFPMNGDSTPPIK